MQKVKKKINKFFRWTSQKAVLTTQQKNICHKSSRRASWSGGGGGGFEDPMY